MRVDRRVSQWLKLVIFWEIIFLSRSERYVRIIDYLNGDKGFLEWRETRRVGVEMQMVLSFGHSFACYTLYTARCCTTYARVNHANRREMTMVASTPRLPRTYDVHMPECLEYPGPLHACRCCTRKLMHVDRLTFSKTRLRVGVLESRRTLAEARIDCSETVVHLDWTHRRDTAITAALHYERIEEVTATDQLVENYVSCFLFFSFFLSLFV